LPAGSLEAEFLRFQAICRQHRGYIIPQAVTHSLMLLKMDEIIAWNMLSWLELLINPYCCIYLVVCIIYIQVHGLIPCFVILMCLLIMYCYALHSLRFWREQLTFCVLY